MLDPKRDKPAPRTCYNAPHPKRDDADHPGWTHPTSWEQVRDHLDADALVTDRDGDTVVGCDISRQVVTLINGREYGYTYDTLLIEDVELVEPTTPQEDEAAMASIMEAFGNRRLAKPGDPLT